MNTLAFSDDDFREAVEALQALPFQPHRWPEALAYLAKAGGGFSSQVLGWDAANHSTAHNFTWGLSDDLVSEWIEYGGLDFERNPRSRLWRLRPSLDVLGEDAYSSEAERARSPIFAEFYKRADAPYSAGAFFDQFDGSGVGVGVLVFRGRSQGPVDAPSAHRLGSLLPHLRSALRARARLDEAAQSIAVGAMEALRQIVVLCNRSGRMIACTGGAEEVLRAADYLRVRSGRLEASDARSNGDLQAAIRRAGSSRDRRDLQPASSSILLMSRAGRPTVADVVPLPSDCFDLRLGGVVLVSLPTGTAVRSSDLLKRAYGLTEAEADICRRLVDGDRVADIAAERQVTQLTVRNQIKAVFSKIGVRSQGELIRAVGVFAKSSHRSPETGS